MTLDDLATLPEKDRTPFFTEAAARLGTLRAQLVEKDFWVCWVLRQLFDLRDFGPHFTFKGGTSLSKAYGAIDRFSEDVDITIDRECLGYGGENDPTRGASRMQRERQLAQLRDDCKAMIANRLAPALRKRIAATLTVANWALEVDGDDGNVECILRFRFPPTTETGKDSYFPPSIKLELGARADPHPAEDRPVLPYVQEALSDVLGDRPTTVRVLHVDRTFWEKATILHMLAHKAVEQPLPPGMSRHYYDLHRLADLEVSRNAVLNTDLLLEVSRHKAFYYRAAWAKYDAARPGSLRLVPDRNRVAELQADYRNMSPMFFGPQPEFGLVLERLRQLEDTVNRMP